MWSNPPALKILDPIWLFSQALKGKAVWFSWQPFCLKGPIYCTNPCSCAVSWPWTPDSFCECAGSLVAETHTKGLCYGSDKSPGRLNGSDDFHAAIWTVVIWKVNSLLVLIGVASVVCLVGLKIKQGEPTSPPQSWWPHDGERPFCELVRNGWLSYLKPEAPINLNIG